MQHRDTETQRKIRTLYLCASVLILLFGNFDLRSKVLAFGKAKQKLRCLFCFALT